MIVKEYKLKDLLTIKNGKDYKNKPSGNIPVYGTGGNLTYINDYLYDGESILLPRKGSLNNIKYVNEKFWTVDTMYWSIINKEIVSTKYLYCYLKLLDLSCRDSGSTLPSMTFDSYYTLKVYLPKLQIQDKIGNFIFKIIDKIKINNKIITELEQMTKTIYDYWFLQFEFPNEEGKPYKSSGGKMVWNDELNQEIPEGWKLKKIVEIEDNIVTGKTPSTKDETNFGGEIPFVTIDDIRKGMYISKTERTLSKKGADLQKNKYIPANSLCITCIATVGLVGITTRQSQTNQQINSIICKNTNNIYFLLNAIRNYFKFSTGAKSGNIFDNMNKEDFSNIKLIYPNKNIIDKYAQKAKPVYDKIRENFLENEELTSLRDYLLPLLMNGQVGFKN